MAGIPEDARLKLSRARQHLQTLNAEVAHFGERHPYGEEQVFERLGLNNADFVLRLKVNREPLREWSETIGDCLHNMRATLDYLVWDLWQQSAGEPDYPRQVEFPIFLTKQGFRAGRTRRIGGLPARAQAAIGRLQPYRSERPEAHPLWVLYELNNRDKHRFLETVTAAIYEAEAEVVGLRNAVVTNYRLAEGPMEAGDEIIRVNVRALGRDPDIRMNLKSVYAIAFSESGPANGRAVVPLLNDIMRYIIDTVFVVLAAQY